MLYELTGQGMKRINIAGKNSLKIGTILKMNGYTDPEYVIVKNLGINAKYAYNGARYLVISLEDLRQSSKDAYLLKFIMEKKDNRIQTYITDEVKNADEVLDLWEKSEAKRIQEQAQQDQAKATADDLEAKGRDLFKKHIPETAKALIIAEYHVNDTDLMSDYFAHHSTNKVILGFSAHTRDLFGEMRKHAGLIPETAHLGPNCGHFEPRVKINEDIQSNGAYYHKGQYSHWHQEMTQKDGQEIPFSWSIEEDSLEHREKYSMGGGYYLKDGGRHSTGWSISKQSYGIASRDNCISLAKRCIF
jgi:hypothetical protein